MKNEIIKVKASQHESYLVYTLIALVIPIVGLILGVVFLTKDTKLERKLGEHLVAVSILFMIIAWVAWMFLFDSLFMTPQVYYL